MPEPWHCSQWDNCDFTTYNLKEIFDHLHHKHHWFQGAILSEIIRYGDNLIRQLGGEFLNKKSGLL